MVSYTGISNKTLSLFSGKLASYVRIWSKYHLPIGNSNLPKNCSETSYLLNKLNVLFEMPVNDTTALKFGGGGASFAFEA